MTDKLALDDPANQRFLELMDADDMEILGHVAVDAGQIELGACGSVQITTDTVGGDGLFPVWRGKKYLVIELDALNHSKLLSESDEFTLSITPN